MNIIILELQEILQDLQEEVNILNDLKTIKNKPSESEVNSKTGDGTDLASQSDDHFYHNLSDYLEKKIT